MIRINRLSLIIGALGCMVSCSWNTESILANTREVFCTCEWRYQTLYLAKDFFPLLRNDSTICLPETSLDVLRRRIYLGPSRCSLSFVLREHDTLRAPIHWKLGSESIDYANPYVWEEDLRDGDACITICGLRQR